MKAETTNNEELIDTEKPTDDKSSTGKRSCENCVCFDPCGARRGLAAALSDLEQKYQFVKRPIDVNMLAFTCSHFIPKYNGERKR